MISTIQNTLFILGLDAVSLWIIFEKAGKPGYMALIPVFNVLVFLEIAEKPSWWILLFCIPYLQIIWMVMAANAFLRKFGDKSMWAGIGFVLLFTFYLPMLAFDKKATYRA